MFSKFFTFSLSAFIALVFTTMSFGQPEPLMHLRHTPGDLTVDIFNDGYIGRAQSGMGVFWKGIIGGNLGGPVFGTSSRSSVNGNIGDLLNPDMQNVSSNFAGGFMSDPDFDQITEAILSDLLAPTPYGVKLTQKTYSAAGDGFVFIRCGYENTTGATLSNFVAGLWVDWIGRTGGYALSENLVYQFFNPFGPEYYYGIASLDGASGRRATPESWPSWNLIRAPIYNFITTFDTLIRPNGYFRSFIGTSLGDIPAGDTIWATFAIIAGDNLDQLIQNAVDARVKAINIEWIVPTDINESYGELPTTFSLLQNYPNPFNPNTLIKYQIPELSFVTLKVYDVLGSEITTLVSEEKPTGSYEVEWDASNVPSGIYFYQLQVESFVETKKMVLLR